MSWILRILWFFFKDRMQMRFFNQVKRQGVIAYLHALSGTRRLLILTIVSVLFLQVIVLSAIGALVTAFILWDYDFQVKMAILCGVFVAMFLLPILLLCVALSERAWYRLSGAEKMVEELRQP